MEEGFLGTNTVPRNDSCWHDLRWGAAARWPRRGCCAEAQRYTTRGEGGPSGLGASQCHGVRTLRESREECGTRKTKG